MVGPREVMIGGGALILLWVVLKVMGKVLGCMFRSMIWIGLLLLIAGGVWWLLR